MSRKLSELEREIRYSFRDRSLLERAMMHSSYVNEKHLPKYACNERLEFLGDAVLELVSSEFLFHEDEKMPEGGADKDEGEHGVRAGACVLRQIDLPGRLSPSWKGRGYDRGTEEGFRHIPTPWRR